MILVPTSEQAESAKVSYGPKRKLLRKPGDQHDDPALRDIIAKLRGATGQAQALKRRG